MSYKMKSHSGAKKRFKLTKNKKVKFKRAKMRHILGHKDQKVKRRLRQASYLAEQDARHIRALLPYA